MVLNEWEIFLSILPILDGKNYDWVIRIEAMLSYQEVLETIKEGTCEKDDIVAKKNYFKTRCLLHQLVDLVNFEKLSKAKITKEAWDILHRAYGGAEKTKKVKLQSLRRLLSMLDQEYVLKYFNQL